MLSQRRERGRRERGTLLILDGSAGTREGRGHGFLYSNGQTVGAEPGPGTVTLTVPQQ